MSEQPQKKLSQQEVVRLERDLAKFANMMDSVVRIPFTKQGGRGRRRVKYHSCGG